MRTLPIPSLRNLRALVVLALTLAVIVAATAASASAAPANGEVVLTLKNGAQSSLLREGVKASPRSGKGRVQTVKLPVSELELGATSVVKTGATLTLSGGGKSVKLKDVELKIGATSTAISAKNGGKSTVFFRASAAAQTVGTAIVVKGPLALTGAGAKALRQALGLDGISGGNIGGANVSAAISAAAPVTPEPPKKQPDAPKVDLYPYKAECPVASVTGGPGGAGDPPGTVDGIAPAPVFDAGTSQEVTGTEVDWGFKQGFREYVLEVGGPSAAGSLQPLGGASAVPTGSGMAEPDSFFEFPASAGSYERGTEGDHSDDKLVVEGTGTVLFCKSAHGFDVVLKNPTVTIDGDESRITADLGANFNGTWYPFQRVDVADLGEVQPTVSDSGNTLVWEEIPASLTEDGSQASGLAGFYPAGTQLDPITVKTSLTRPLRSQCTVAEGTGVPPALTIGLPTLPVLSSPVTGSGGTINWGLRRATRASVAAAPGGSFQMFGGATEGYPGNMGGAEAAPPTGGQGKFFRFPISSYEYDEGEAADPNDDRLIATSEASVGFCNPGGGNYGLMISKPTLVIDGTSSSLVANAYSFSGGAPNPNAAGWMGGRVKVVDLNSTTVSPVTAAGKVSWGDIPTDNNPIAAGIPVVGGFQTNALAMAFLAAGSGTTAGGFDPVTAQIDLPAP